MRAKGAMVCGIDGYPTTGCGEAVKDAQVPTDEEPVEFALASSDASEDGSGSSAAVIGIVAAAIVLLGGGALLVNRRRAVQD